MAVGLSPWTKMFSPWWWPPSHPLEHGTSVPAAPSRHSTFMPMYDGSTLASFTKQFLPDVYRHYGIALLIAKMLGTRWIIMRMVSRTFVAQVRSDFRHTSPFVYTPNTLASSPSLATPSPLRWRVTSFAKATPPRLQWLTATPHASLMGALRMAGFEPPGIPPSPVPEAESLLNAGECATTGSRCSENTNGRSQEGFVGESDDEHRAGTHGRPHSRLSRDSQRVPIADTDVHATDVASPLVSPVSLMSAFKTVSSSGFASDKAMGFPSSTREALSEPEPLPPPPGLPPPSAPVIDLGDPEPNIDYRSIWDPYNHDREKRNDIVLHHQDTYSILGTLGEGGFGRVFAARRNINQVVAVKVTHKWKHYRKGQGDRASLLRERDCMALAALNNVPFWAKLLASWEDAHNVYFVMDVCLGTLSERLTEVKRRPLDAPRMCAEMVLAVSYLEKHEIIHSDIKPENFLVTSREDHLVLTDFGVADRRPSASDVPFDEWYLGGRAGTTTYMSPETLLLEETYHRSDIYSLGLVFLQVFLGWVTPVLYFDPKGSSPPGWPAAEDVWRVADSVDRQIMLMSVPWVRSWSMIPEKALPRTCAEWKLCEKMLDRNRAARPSASELRRDEFFGEAFMLEVYNDVRMAHYRAQNGDVGTASAGRASIEKMKIGPDDRDLGFGKWHRGDEYEYDAHAEFRHIREGNQRRVWLLADREAREQKMAENRRQLECTKETDFVAPSPPVHPPTPEMSLDGLDRVMRSECSPSPKSDAPTDLEYPVSEDGSAVAQPPDDEPIGVEESATTPSMEDIHTRLESSGTPPDPLRLGPVSVAQGATGIDELAPERSPKLGSIVVHIAPGGPYPVKDPGPDEDVEDLICLPPLASLPRIWNLEH